MCGWRWTGSKEHINCLGLRAVLTSIKWRVQHKKQQIGVRFLHLIDSLVVLHALSRGRSSSKKLRSTLSRVNALLLCSSSQALWGYVQPDQNPADRPSRWGSRVKTKDMPKRHLEAATHSNRAKQRQRLGQFKDLTVQPATKQRYSKAIDGFLAFLKANDLILPRQRQQLDPLVCEYLEHLWYFVVPGPWQSHGK